MSSHPPSSPLYEIKSADWPLVAFLLKSPNVSEVSSALATQLAESPGFFENDAVLIDADALPADGASVDWPALVRVLRQHGMWPVAMKSTHPAQQAQALAAGLCVANDARVKRSLPAAPAPAPPAASAAPAGAPSALADALVWDKPLRSGQQVYAKGRDLVMLAMVNPGAEVLADGHIHVYAPLRGKAIAGARGYTGARIFAQSMDPELISIAGVYRTSENPLSADVRGHAAQVCLQSNADGEKLMISALKL